jgi:hypothetical protein
MSDRERDQLLEPERTRAWEALIKPWTEDFARQHKVLDRTRDRQAN